ncbi:MAG: SRPBCC family protein [Nevskia sp.]|nr:SRPBCC family protein [Nevskia sp.]
MAYAALVERTIAMPRARFFAQIADFGGIGKFLPDMVESAEMQGQGVGALRLLRMKGMPGILAERLEAVFDQRLLSYTLTVNPGLPLEHYHAVVELADAPGGGTVVRWGSNWVAKGAPEAEVRSLLTGLYNTIIDGILKDG